MEIKSLKKDLIKSLSLITIFILIMAVLLYLDNKNQIIEKIIK